MNAPSLFSFIGAFLFFAFAQGQSTLLYEDFESGALPPGWSNISNASDGGWQFGSNTQLQSPFFPIPAHTLMAATNDAACNCDKSNEYLITSPLDFSGTSQVYLELDAFFTKAMYQNKKEKAVLLVSSNGGNSWLHAFTFPASETWATYGVNLSSYAGNNHVLIAVNYQDNSGWMKGMALDNIWVYAPAAGNDLAIASVAAGKYDARPAFVSYAKYLTGTPLFVRVTVANRGTTTLTSFDLTLSDGVTTLTESITGIQLEPLQRYVHEFAVPAQMQAGTFSYTASIAEVNDGEPDVSATNNSQTVVVNIVSPAPNKKYLAENATGTWCAWCTRGIAFSNYMKNTYPDQYIGIHVHEDDPMENSVYSTGISSMPGFLGYPSVTADREYVIDPLDVEADFIERMTQEPPVLVDVEAVYQPGMQMLQVTVHAEFTQNLQGDFRIDAIIVEDSVQNSSSGYSQYNAYAYNIYGPMGGFESLPTPIPATQMVHRHVGRELLSGSFYGTANVLPTVINAGDQFSHAYLYPVPSEVNLSQVQVVGIVTRYQSNSSNVVLNANSAKWTLATSSATHAVPDFAMAVYPNPAKEKAAVHFSIAEPGEVVVALKSSRGQTVKQYCFNGVSGWQQKDFDLSGLQPGMYFVHVKTGGYSTGKKLIVTEQ
ncbi:MAG: Omp28-related outer membrane protein [Chitinophagales bacterium]|nr:T9SS type A sorting domain-containing protein [Chitinophagales bacterium]MDW8392903.1 Omp28-related outer membrane protein [Chitinophagales bacterium]